MAEPGKNLEVRVMHADNIPSINLVNRLSDPYATLLHLRGDQSLQNIHRAPKPADASIPPNQTVTCGNTLTPRWYQSFYVDDVCPGDVLRVQVWDSQTVREHVPIGSTDVSLNDALAYTEQVLACRPSQNQPPFAATESLYSSPSVDRSASSSDSKGYLPGSHPSPETSSCNLPDIQYRSPQAYKYLQPPPPPPPQPPSSSVQNSQIPQFVNVQYPPPPSTQSSAMHFYPPSIYPSRPPPHPYQTSATNYMPMNFQPVYAQPYPATYTAAWPLSTEPVSPDSSTRIEADLNLQNAFARSYNLFDERRQNAYASGRIWLVIVDRATVSDLSETVVSHRYSCFVNHKMGQRIVDISGKQSEFGATRFGKTLFSAADSVFNAAKHFNSTFDMAILHPIQAALREHPTWKIDLSYVDEIFGEKRQAWNHNYPKAQKIFTGSLHIPLQRAIVAQHSYLYGGILKEVRKDFAHSGGEIICAQDFIQVANFGMRNGKTRMFTYVIMPQREHQPARLYFAETGAKFFQDINSKHAMHSSAAREVIYAGEFHFRRRHNPYEPEIRLVVDNNSGTYAPNKADLPKVQQLFERNFEGLVVEVLDFNDPVLKQYCAEIPRGASMEFSSRDSTQACQ